MKILVTYDMFREGFTELESKYEVTFPEGRDFTYEEVFEMIPEYDVLCSMFDFPVNKELIDHASKLRLIANYAVGYNNIDVAYALEKGLTVANTPDPVTAPTANIALGLMLDTARRITECDRKLRTLGKDMKVGVLENLGMPVTGQTLGIIGMGRIGKALAKRANALGMDVIYHNRRQLCIEDETKLNVTYVSKEELLAKADFVSLNAPYTPDTYHILGEEEFKQMKPSAILIVPFPSAFVCNFINCFPRESNIIYNVFIICRAEIWNVYISPYHTLCNLFFLFLQFFLHIFLNLQIGFIYHGLPPLPAFKSILLTALPYILSYSRYHSPLFCLLSESHGSW